MSDEGGLEYPLLVLVSVAPFELYRDLFESGPASTWVLDSTPGVIIGTWSGLPLTKFRRSMADLREMMRFPLTTPRKVGTVDATSSTMRAYEWSVNFALPDLERPNQGAARLARRVVAKSLTTMSRVVGLFERTVVTRWKNLRGSPAVVEVGEHLWIQRPATVSNSTQLEQALLRYLAKSERIAGVLIVSASAYIDQRRLRQWVDRQEKGEVVVGGGRNPAASGPDFLSGFCQYFSWEAIRILAQAKDLNHGVANDEALTKWLVERSITWRDPGIAWSTAELEAGSCPMCNDLKISVVRCTSHGSRSREAAYMKLLHHDHLLL